MDEKKLNPPPSAGYSDYVNREKWAIIVGISQYQDESLNLKYADQDAEELCKLIQTSSGGGFSRDKIIKLTNKDATTFKIYTTLRKFLQRPGREDVVFFYFSCHGAPDPNKPDNVYLITHDTDPNDIAGTGLHMEDIDLSIKRHLLSERIIILADTCHSGAIGGGIGRKGSVIDDSTLMNRYLEAISQAIPGIALLTSAEANEVSFEDAKWGGGHGVFTHYLLQGMGGQAANQEGIVTIGNLFEYVRRNVQKATDYKQHPLIGSNVYDRSLPIAIVPNFNPPPPTPEPIIEPNLDITCEVPLTNEMMSRGTKERIVTSDGLINVTIPAGVRPGKRFRVKGKGKLDPVGCIERFGGHTMVNTKRRG